MAHFAKVLNGRVLNVIIAEPELFGPDSGWVDDSPGEWIQTSYNVEGGVYIDPETGKPAPNQEEEIAKQDGRQRKNYAAVGDEYHHDLDLFCRPKPYLSWILNPNTGFYEPPVPKPQDGNGYIWDEETQSWENITEEDEEVFYNGK